MQLSLFPELEEEELRHKEEAFTLLRKKLKKANAYSKDEELYQRAQEHWDKEGDLKSWNIMYFQIQKACFNCINKKLNQKASHDTIEGYSHDVTLNILNNINKKKAAGEFWKIAKLSAFVYLPCLAIFQKQKEFEDKILDESAYTLFEDGEEFIKEDEGSFFDGGIYHI